MCQLTCTSDHVIQASWHNEFFVLTVLNFFAILNFYVILFVRGHNIKENYLANYIISLICIKVPSTLWARIIINELYIFDELSNTLVVIFRFKLSYAVHVTFFQKIYKLNFLLSNVIINM